MDLNYNQEIQIGGQTVTGERREVLIDSMWNRVKNACVPIAAIAILTGTGLLAYSCGQKNPDCNSNCGPATSATTPAQTPVASHATDDRLASAVEKIAEKLADAKPATANATASATATTAKTPPTTVVVKVVEVLRLQLKDPEPPVPSLDLPEKPAADPMAGMTPEQRCAYEIVKLRRAQCNR